MTKANPEFLNLLLDALSDGEDKRGSGPRIDSLLDWLRVQRGAERGFVVSSESSGDYHIWCSRDSTGRKIPAAQKSISHHAFDQACEGEEPVIFLDAHLDRRMRSPAETDGVQRARWIEVIPLNHQRVPSAIYFDSRFGEGPSPEEPSIEQSVAVALLEKLLGLGSNGSSSRKKEQVRRQADVEESLPPAVPAAPPKERVFSQIGKFVSYSSEIQKLIEELNKIKGTDIPVFIEGESGTGKELLARAIHQGSGLEGEFVVLHCGTVTESLVEIELFGNAKGAFTDAHQERKGLLDFASGGTLFLDAIDEASPALQAALLRVIESGSYRRVAASEEVEADVRFLACSSVVKKNKKVRPELRYRLAGFEVHISPLRERPEDALLILDQVLAEEKVNPPEIQVEAQALLLAQRWPGNGWDVVHLAHRLATSGHDIIDVDRLQELLRVMAGTSPVPSQGVRDVLGRAEREVIQRALTDASGNKSVACETLGISRRTLYRRMKKHGIPLKETDPDDS